ncbi:DNA primase [Pantoea phage vB_PagM_LIET2]|uniref:DNA primase/polymerase n=1 Tax=Pantoea phage vB_PagM_LIET2 TaxID=2508071 RepID=A0A411AW87_9CAUD|nr:DNA primase [Pantoea phage vB_PagM_LIET2]QAX92371.1 DNA primase/polymerase [Pantoea phage vB_PagM_LIET2]
MQDLQYWQHYAEAGFRIIPMMPMEPNAVGGMSCTCNRGSQCKAIGKHPKSKNWQKDRRISLNGLKMEFGRRGLPYYGVALEGWLVVDVDPRNGGLAGLEALEAALDMNLADESLFVVSTGGGGTHFYFHDEGQVRLRTGMKEFPGVDFKRGAGHFVMGAGSLHKSGGTYDVITGSPLEIGPAPAALIELIKAPEWDAYDGPHGEAPAALVESALFAIPNDDVPYDDWLVIGMALAHWDDPKNWELFDRWSQQSTKYDENETDRKFRSFGESGGRTIGTIFGIAADHGWVRPQGPAWGTLDEATGELVQDPEVRAMSGVLAAAFQNVSLASIHDGMRRYPEAKSAMLQARIEARDQAAAQEPEVVFPDVPELPETPEQVVRPAGWGDGWKATTVGKRGAAPADPHDMHIPEDDVEFGEVPEFVAKVMNKPEYQQATPAPVAAPASVPPAPKKPRPADIRTDRLPGLAGRIVDHMEKTAWAFQRPAAEAAALQALSCAAWGAYGYADAPLSLITLVVADTASGKDHPQKVFTKLMQHIGREIYPETRSDKDFMYGLEKGDGKMCLVIDEAHAFFGAMENDRAPAYLVNMAALLLKAATSDTLFLARNHLEDMLESKRRELGKFEKLIEKVADRKGVWEVKTQEECDAEIRKLSARVEHIQYKMEDLKTGIKGIHFNLMASSTPVKFEKYINAETVGSGLTGRSLVFDCGYGAPPQRKDVPPSEAVEFHELAAILQEISNQAMAGMEVRAQDDAMVEFEAIYDKYIANDDNYNHPEMGGLNRRIRERVYAVSSILAAGNSWVITPEIVRTALRLCEGHLSASRSMLKQNEWEGSEKDAKVALTEVILKILKRTDQEKYMPRSSFRQRLEKNSTAKKINKQMTNPKMKGSDFLSRRVGELKAAQIIATNGSDDDYTRIWLTKKGKELAAR